MQLLFFLTVRTKVVDWSCGRLSFQFRTERYPTRAKTSTSTPTGNLDREAEMPKQEEFRTSLERTYCSLYDAYSYLDDALRLQASCPPIFNELSAIKNEVVKSRMDIHAILQKDVSEKG